MCKYETRGRLWVLTKAVESWEHKDSRLTHTGDSLAEYVDTHDGLRYALLLHVTRMLETAINDGLL